MRNFISGFKSNQFENAGFLPVHNSVSLNVEVKYEIDYSCVVLKCLYTECAA